MTSFDEIVRLYRIDRVELATWIERRWVRPRQAGGNLVFDEVDRARIELIRELGRDLVNDEDSLGLVLSLLDQLYAARQMLKTVEEAIEALPEDVRREIRERLRPPPE
jgi:chaperone modulatory protein CbpM